MLVIYRVTRAGRGMDTSTAPASIFSEDVET